MRTVIVCNIVSLDGRYEGPGGDFTALDMDGAFDAYNLDLIRRAGTVVLGRRSFELFGSFWPAVADAPEDASDPVLTDVNREFSRRCNRIPKVVVSDSYTPPLDHPWTDTTTVVPRAEVGAWIAEERGNGSGDIVVFASRTLWTGLLEEDLIDEIHLAVDPVVLAAGTPLFQEPAALETLDALRLDGSNNVLLRLRPKR
ncbi:Dihydrofolate reductase [Glycomyces sambucus]|uniref:Dihydrofolate reductase n=1 Tax=Glycomyces sambucus TaxID=380244 RepID=A0A1G9H5A2_9ACTN|nr:dihydrofolate reductase family protein [Glycomyces sambucus]SDL08055.1 Dihydrofolate reductase [Glycomyces sambucus]